MFNSVDFPEPLTPLIVTKSPLLTVNAWIEKMGLSCIFFWILDRETISFLFITFPFKDLIRLSFFNSKQSHTDYNDIEYHGQKDINNKFLADFRQEYSYR